MADDADLSFGDLFGDAADDLAMVAAAAAADTTADDGGDGGRDGGEGGEVAAGATTAAAVADAGSSAAPTDADDGARASTAARVRGRGAETLYVPPLMPLDASDVSSTGNTAARTRISLLRLPKMIAVATRPYDAETHDAEAEERELHAAGKPASQHAMIRWRPAAATGAEVASAAAELQTNSRVVEWSDGSLTLHIGTEVFQLRPTTAHGGTRGQEATHLFQAGVAITAPGGAPASAGAANVNVAPPAGSRRENVLMCDRTVDERLLVRAMEGSVVAAQAVIATRSSRHKRGRLEQVHLSTTASSSAAAAAAATSDKAGEEGKGAKRRGRGKVAAAADDSGSGAAAAGGNSVKAALRRAKAGGGGGGGDGDADEAQLRDDDDDDGAVAGRKRGRDEGGDGGRAPKRRRGGGAAGRGGLRRLVRGGKDDDRGVSIALGSDDEDEEGDGSDRGSDLEGFIEQSSSSDSGSSGSDASSGSDSDDSDDSGSSSSSDSDSD